MSEPTILNSLSGSQQTTSTLTEAGGLELKTNIWFDTKNGSNLPEDNSYVLLQDKYKSLVQMIGGNLVLKSNADLFLPNKKKRNPIKLSSFAPSAFA
jgi:hypothetical protein